jgi:hypothetical protein
VTLGELTALVLLYRACRDDALRCRVLKLVPDLSLIVEDDQPTNKGDQYPIPEIPPDHFQRKSQWSVQRALKDAGIAINQRRRPTEK